MIKLVSFGLAIGIVLYIFFYLPKRLKKAPGAKFRYVVFSVFAVLSAMMLLKFFR